MQLDVPRLEVDSSQISIVTVQYCLVRCLSCCALRAADAFERRSIVVVIAELGDAEYAKSR